MALQIQGSPGIFDISLIFNRRQEFQITKKTQRKMKNVKSQILFCWSNTWSIRPGNTQQSSTVNVSTSYFTKNPKFETFDFSFFFMFSLYFEILVILRCFPKYIASYGMYPICKSGASSTHSLSSQPPNLESHLEIKAANHI